MTSPLRSATLCLLVATSLAACAHNQSRPTPSIARPDTATLDRLRVNESVRETAPVSLIALPAGTSVAAVYPDRTEVRGESAQEAALTFEELIRSVEKQFPLILAALETIESAEGELMSAKGGFDLQLKAQGEFGLQGFYENEIGRVALEQPTTVLGATLFGGYKIGTGDFPTWDGDLRTNRDGEFNAGLRLPLLAGRSIDARRLALWQARITQAQAQPFVLKSRLSATRKAARAYWNWAAAGQRLDIANRLVSLAVDRHEAVGLGVKEGELPRIALVENRRLVVERESIVARSDRRLQQAAIALSLFWRDANGVPLIPPPERLPAELPTPSDPDLFILPSDIDLALKHRPEIREIELQLENFKLRLEKADNDLLPQLDLAVTGSKDIGGDVSNPDDKGPFEVTVFVQFDVPLQRRAARGRVRSLSARSAQIKRALQFARNSVVADVQDASSALRQTWLRLAQVRENVQLAGEIEEVERVQLLEGESDLLRVNLREQQTAAAAAMLVDVVAEHFQSLANYRASLGVPYDEVLRTEP